MKYVFGFFLAACLYGQQSSGQPDALPMAIFHGLDTQDGFTKAMKNQRNLPAPKAFVDLNSIPKKCSIPLLPMQIPEDRKFASRILPESKVNDPMPKVEVPAPACK